MPRLGRKAIVSKERDEDAERRESEKLLRHLRDVLRLEWLATKPRRRRRRR
jgi:hypothetical protein